MPDLALVPGSWLDLLYSAATVGNDSYAAVLEDSPLYGRA